EMNESQPVCPGCGTLAGGVCDDPDVAAILEDAPLIAAVSSELQEPDYDIEPEPEESLNEPDRLPPDLQTAFEDAESLLLAIGHAGFSLPGDKFRVFRLPTDRVM
ncbi:MAG: hypothetical protein ACM3W7_00135, partial [Acidobacteriota bacterium]